MKRWVIMLELLLFPVALLSAPDVILPFQVGETVEYRIHWGLVNVGYSRFSTEWVDYDGRKLIAVRLRNRTNDVLSTLYPVDDFVESLIDPETFLPVRFIKKLKQGSYRCDEETTFDHAHQIAYFVSHQNGTTKEYAIEPQTRDILSFLYYSRLEEFEPGKIVQRKLMADEKLYNLDIHCGEIEKVDVGPYGSVDCLKMEPKASFAGIFVRKGRMWMWISRDPRRICTELKSKIMVGNVSLTLTSVEGPGDDFWVNPPADPEPLEKPRPKRPPFRRR